jgi:hypothetical protein
MRRILLTGIIFPLILIMGSTQFPGNASGGPPFGGPEDLNDAKQVWKALTDARLVGDQSINAMPYIGSVHKTILITQDSTIHVGGRTGMVIVKKMYQGPEISVEKVIDDPTKNLKVVAVMFKREKGYDPDNQDWLYTKFGPDGIPQKNKKGVSMTGRAGVCIGCHKSAAGDDYIYSFDR